LADAAVTASEEIRRVALLAVAQLLRQTAA
jgi:hypothetical protein